MLSERKILIGYSATVTVLSIGLVIAVAILSLKLQSGLSETDGKNRKMTAGSCMIGEVCSNYICDTSLLRVLKSPKCKIMNSHSRNLQDLLLSPQNECQ